jgi:uncharacterized protein YndB with AHSA1/START domain
VSNSGELPSAEVTRILSAPPGVAFDAWLDEAVLPGFICPAPGRATDVSVDARVGGRYRFQMSLPDRELVVDGEYIAIDRPDRLAFTWRCSDTEDLQTVVTVTFAAHGRTGTLMTITHSLLPGSLIRQHLEGWALTAAQLDRRLG